MMLRYHGPGLQSVRDKNQKTSYVVETEEDKFLAKYNVLKAECKAAGIEV